ncbi:hypothetical protein [Nocardia sp. NPDC051463]|uniref:hypothetical protein n=1 Tax=Nocardia sp. NPDC051463 TaxID=3154845 RepID=UPI0034394EF3
MAETERVRPACTTRGCARGLGFCQRTALLRFPVTTDPVFPAYEKDPHYAGRLRSRYAGNDRIRCVHADFRLGPLSIAGSSAPAPVPGVDAAVLRLTRRQQPLPPPEAMADYRRVVGLGFAGGSFASSRRRAFPPRTVRTACASAGIAADLPVGFVPPDSWLAVYRALW